LAEGFDLYLKTKREGREREINSSELLLCTWCRCW